VGRGAVPERREDGNDLKVEYRVFVNGVPKAQPRPRMMRNGHVFNPHSADAWKDAVKAAFMARKPIITGPVGLYVKFFMPIPKGLKVKEGVFIPHIKKPDTDNLLKAVMDSLTQVGVWKDDSQVYSAEAVKGYAHGKVGALVEIAEH
jgi:Holliday junction resolvase RusA-like endonuclease